MRALLIDPERKTVTQIKVKDFEDAKKVMQCTTAEVPYTLHNGDMLLVNENGLLENPEFFFVLAGYDRPIAGKAIILGSEDTEDGREFKSALTTKIGVKFLGIANLGPYMAAEEAGIEALKAKHPGAVVHAITMRQTLGLDGSAS